MSLKTSKVRVFSVHGGRILARRDATRSDIRAWLARTQELAVEPADVHLVPLSECAAQIEAEEFEAEDLPMFL